MNDANILAVHSLLGEKVKNTDGLDLGSINELLVDAVTGKVEYGVISFGGLLGVGSKNIAVPYEAFILNKEEEVLYLNVDKETLETANTTIQYEGKEYYIY